MGSECSVSEMYLSADIGSGVGAQIEHRPCHLLGLSPARLPAQRSRSCPLSAESFMAEVIGLCRLCRPRYLGTGCWSGRVAGPTERHTVIPILDGMAAVALGIRTRGEPYWVWTTIRGVVSVLAGLIALIWPGITALALLFLIAFWVITLGAGEIGGAFSRPAGADRPRGAGALAAGILNVVFGVLLLIWPSTGILTLVWLVGIFTLAGGIALVILAFRVRSVARSIGSALEAADPPANHVKTPPMSRPAVNGLRGVRRPAAGRGRGRVPRRRGYRACGVPVRRGGRWRRRRPGRGR